MRFQVPQNIDVPDTIFLGLNFTQIIYLGGSLGFFVFLVLFAGGFGVAFLFGTPLVILAALLSFFSFNSQSFATILQAMIYFFTRKRLYVWKQDKSDVYSERHLKKDSSDTEPHKQDAPRDKERRLQGLGVDLMFDDSNSSESELTMVI